MLTLHVRLDISHSTALVVLAFRAASGSAERYNCRRTPCTRQEQSIPLLDHRLRCPEYEKALAAYRAVDNRHGEAITLGLIGNCYKHLGDRNSRARFSRVVR